MPGQDIQTLLPSEVRNMVGQNATCDCGEEMEKLIQEIAQLKEVIRMLEGSQPKSK